jgi:hypothetical protein
MTDSPAIPPSPTNDVLRLGDALTAAARTPDDRECLEMFAELLSLESDGGRPHLLTVLLEPDGAAQILMIGHACPGLTVQVGADHSVNPVQLWFDPTEDLTDRWPAPPQ